MTEFGRQMLNERYYTLGESEPEHLFARVSIAGSDNAEHAGRLAKYMEKEWFMPSTPELANLGTDRGLPISCFLNRVKDSKKGIFDKYQENFYLGAGGGGIGTDWSDVREINSPVGGTGVSSGIIPFIKVSDSSTLAVSQGGLRRASQAVYLDMSHPEIEEFIELRKPSGADLNRRCLNIHHGVKLSDEFMEAVLAEKPWDLISPKDGSVVRTVDAFDLFAKLLTTRIENGEPYIFFSDNANRNLTESYKANNMSVTMSNLCTEIMQATGHDRTAVCALASFNLAKWDEWKDDEQFIEDVVRFQDNVLDIFVAQAKDNEAYDPAIKSVTEERNIGLGVMGFHTYLQAKRIPFESALASGWNQRVFKHINKLATKASEKIGKEKGCPLLGSGRRNNLLLSVAPTSSISILCGEVSAGIEPLLANVFTHKNLIGTTIARNKELDKVISTYDVDKEAAWKSIIEMEGSVQHLDWMSKDDKDVFKTAKEIDQRWIIEHAAVRQPYIDQGQSVNVFLPGDIDKLSLFNLHVMAWKRGLKSLYYCRSTAPARAVIGNKVVRKVIPQYDEGDCLSCQ